MRGVLAAIVAIIGYFGVTFALAWAQAASNPLLAYRLAPYDGRLSGSAAIAMTTTDIADASMRTRGERLARRALLQDPMAVPAVTALGVNAEARGDIAAARRLFHYAQLLTRRDQRTQLWAIEDAVRRDDVADALRQYDIALRTMPKMKELLYPVLRQASADDGVRPALVQTLAKNPIWRDNFIDYVAGDKDSDPVAMASLFIALQRARVPVAATAQNRVVDALLGAGKNDSAWNYYALIRPGAVRERSRDPRFSGAGETPSQFDWVPSNDNGIASSMSTGVFDFSVSPSIGGVLLRQDQLLPPGTYRLTGHTSGINQPDDARPYWSLACQNGKELGRVPLPNSSADDGGFSGTITVRSDCPRQTLNLVARPSDSVGGSSGQINRMELIPLP